MQTTQLSITGMDCPDCARTLERGIIQLNGVADCAINFASAQLTVTFDPQHLDQQAITARVRALGYDINPLSVQLPTAEKQHHQGVLRALLRRGNLPLLGGALLLLAGLLCTWLGGPAQLSATLELLAIIVAGTPLALNGVRALWLSRRITINLLMTIAAIGAVIIGERAEAATLIILFGIGELLEATTLQRSRDALRNLMRLAPAEATVLSPCLDCDEHQGREGYSRGPCPWCTPQMLRLPVEQVQVGQLMLVKPGERIPLDGTIQRGESLINQQHITGESLPVARGVGAEVYAGSINGDGALEIVVSRPANASLLSRIATLVEQAQSRRAPIERFIDRFATIYTPAVVGLALLVALLPPLLFGQPFWNPAPGEHGWLYRALALLVVACPCALVISTPVSIVSALSAATRSGALVKGGAALEALRQVKVFAFDKTGTLTSGQPQVTAVACADACCTTSAASCAHCDEVLALAAAIEHHSSHPLATAVVQAAHARQLDGRYTRADAVVALPGRGIQGQVAGRRITVGSHALFDAEHPHDPTLCARVSAAEAKGQTALLVCACDGSGVQGYITVADTPRAISRRVLSELHAAGIARNVVLTGDNPSAGQAIAAAVGADEVRAALLPADKLAAVRELHARYGPVAMVGDGINDTPALAAATVGIAMGAAGSAQALETADIALISDDLTRLPFLLRLSRRTAAIIGQNITLSLLIKLGFLALALGGWATLWAAVLADVGAALIVTLNGMRLLREQS